jgi:hypothetical protein
LDTGASTSARRARAECEPGSCCPTAERRLELKRRDGGADQVLLLVADTPRNRPALAAAPAAFGDLPLRIRAGLRALRAGTDPGASGIVFL